MKYEALNDIKQRPVISVLNIKPSMDEAMNTIKETKGREVSKHMWDTCWNLEAWWRKG